MVSTTEFLFSKSKWSEIEIRSGPLNLIIIWKEKYKWGKSQQTYIE